MLAVSTFNHCEYCMAGHTYVARTMQLEEPVLQSLRTAASSSSAIRATSALRSFVEVVLRECGFAGNAAVEAFINAGFTHQNALEVLTIITAKTL